ncbi:MAG: heme lyase CcmF/NrfE family subunit [Candidatus Paracaedimonas acanthamoebae]|uniref:Heme lyase CcmF/NrfE family subunit n=1 Tax=Candidatus Paracaedimonas acanthamoebae TaxID=244581 RepID=A0A8J7TSX8_9PROT|nr:heme lyase CcmF/NrfE family subunit [Candidatus Paracaedimonas acanthamoebae]
MNEFGESALYAAVIIMLINSVVPLFLVKKQTHFALQLGRLGAFSSFILLTLSFLTLIYAFLMSDFSLQIVASHSHSKTPLLYKITGVWGNHEGSMILWVWALTFYTFLMQVRSSSEGTSFIKTRLKLLSIQSGLGIGFLAYVLILANPFMRAMNIAYEGQDLNAVLQDPALAIHPPLLYLGYVGFSVPYSYAIVGLIENKITPSWARSLRRWVLMSWIFLTLGIATGSFWAYYELGWGGYWFWDPVENAALMPWLLGTALIHSLLALEKKGSFKFWGPLLGIITFILCLIGTYLVRSGAINSVHSFATDPTRGAFIFGFTVLISCIGIGFFIYRAPKLTSSHSFHLFSREGGITVNNFLLTLMSGLILLGTISPLLGEFWLTRKLVVGSDYFQMMVIPLTFLMMIFMIGGPIFVWAHTTRKQLSRWVNFLILGSILIFGVLGFGSCQLSFGVVGLVLTSLILLSSFMEWRRRNLKLNSYAMLFAHSGMAISIMGMCILNLWSSKTTILLKEGEKTNYQGYTFYLKEIKTYKMPTYEARQAYLEINNGQEKPQLMVPEKRFYQSSQVLTTEVALKHHWLTDLYIVLGGVLPKKRWVFEIAVYPGIQLLWIGALLMALGGFISLVLAFLRQKKVMKI